ncbi:hypothetical protein FISHEDRAFT_61068 [Fistulina hepatica ATCC 64428]|uniref:HNH nuclease domain-containing protein n=1 Tax=Fistulina hepatica ATCC 64428 TaxID=1128425 RepID=A0A0D7A4J6_9AGAR|nr:hypothetical protein FISHEDRAFT_61068 [Fistulina hepatica ATCC 64428]
MFTFLRAQNKTLRTTDRIYGENMVLENYHPGGRKLAYASQPWIASGCFCYPAMDASYVARPRITPVDHVKSISILHPVHGICFLEFGCRDRVEEDNNFVDPKWSTRTAISQWVKSALDKACILSGSADPLPLDAAHLIPQEHANWVAHFNIISKLAIRRSIPRGTDNITVDVRNLITLERGLHAQTDGHLFTFFPISSSVVCAYFAAPHPMTAAAMYHLVQINLPARIDPFFLYCRFAWNVIGRVMRMKMMIRSCSIPKELRHKGRKRRRGADSGGAPGSSAGGGVAGASDGGSTDDSESQSRQGGEKESTEYMDLATFEKKYFGPQVGSLEKIAKMEETIDPETRQMFDEEEASDDEAKPSQRHSSLFTDMYYAYPGMTEIARLKLQYIQEHKSVTETGEETTVRKDDDLCKGLLHLN